MSDVKPTVEYSSTTSAVAPDRWVFRFSLLWCAATLFLLVAGGMVTSTGSGLAVPDWPTTYDQPMFRFPLSGMVGGIFYEHGHRLVATSVGMMTCAMVGLLFWREKRAWIRKLGYFALAAVIVQGLLGGLTVRLMLPAPVSIGHAGLAQIFFCTVVAITLFLSPGWIRAVPRPVFSAGPGLRGLCLAATALIYVQIVLGAVVRHTQSGLAIPDFPLSYGTLVPPFDADSLAQINVNRRWDPPYLPEVTAGQIAAAFAHRANALLVVALVAAAAIRVLRNCRGETWLTRPAWLLLGLLPIQILLGAWTVWSLRTPAINTAHVVVGACLLATSLVLALRTRRLYPVEPVTAPRVIRVPGALEGAAT